MHEGQQGVFSLFREGQRYDRFFAQGVRRQPGMLDSTRPLHLSESPVMGNALEAAVKEPVHFRIQEQLLTPIGAMPQTAEEIWTQPVIKHALRKSREGSFKLRFKGLLRVLDHFFTFFFLSLKCCSDCRSTHGQ